MASSYVVNGTLRDNTIVVLDEPIPIGTTRVRLVLEVLSPESSTGSLRDFLADLRARQTARGHIPRSKEEIDAAIRADRDSWGD
jgi:hypothetical protein